MHSNTQDYLYENVPLIEVIAEIHWALKAIESVPNARIDPFYDLFRDTFLTDAKSKGLCNEEVLIPNLVPLELSPNKPRLRLRTEPQEWPLVQIGPGILTSNIVPPYNGWNAFEPFLFQQIDRLFSSYPLSEKTFRVAKIQLRYVDGFDEERLGFKNYASFADKMLGIPMPLRNDFVNANIEGGSEVSYVLESRFVCTNPPGSLGLLKLAPGRVNDKNALIMEMQCEAQLSDRTSNDLHTIKSWFREAHSSLHQQFDSLATEELKRIMGSKKEIQS